jgi:hypothetical protein
MAITKLNNKAVANITTLPVALGNMVFISSQTASASASISFTTGIDSTYKEYQFYFVNMHPSINSHFVFNLSTNGGSNYNVTKTTTSFGSGHRENGAETLFGYDTASDLAQSTSDQRISANGGIDTGNDESLSGSFQLFNPASTTYVKHFISNTQHYHGTTWSLNSFMAGYGNTTSAINAVQFKFVSGNIDAGKILMFGLN